MSLRDATTNLRKIFLCDESCFFYRCDMFSRGRSHRLRLRDRRSRPQRAIANPFRYRNGSFDFFREREVSRRNARPTRRALRASQDRRTHRRRARVPSTPMGIANAADGG